MKSATTTITKTRYTMVRADLKTIPTIEVDASAQQS